MSPLTVWALRVCALLAMWMLPLTVARDPDCSPTWMSMSPEILFWLCCARAGVAAISASHKRVRDACMVVPPL